MIKADAYGHGAIPVARRLLAEGADRFAVAIVEEGIELRRGGISGQILILNHSEAPQARVCAAYALTPTLWDLKQATAFAETTRPFSSPLPVHLKIDTGMGRLGISPGEVGAVSDILRGARGLSLEGTFTQLARAGEADADPTRAQIAAMKRCLEGLRAAGVDPGVVHVANSAGLLAHTDSFFDAVRPGIALYGILPAERIREDELGPAMTLETRVLSVRNVRGGDAIGYGGAFVARRPSTIAVLPIGYHDGVRRSFSGRVSVLLRGEEAPIVGAVSMDLTAVDASSTGATPGDRVVLLGSEGARSVTAWDLARAAGTIPYEIVCGVSARVPRVYS